MNRPAKLYDRDFVLWTQEQARALRDAAQAGANLPLDWENLAEEVESLGRSDRRELENRIETILEHLLKLAFSPAAAPRAKWKDTVARSRAGVARLLRDSPSLRPELQEIVAEELGVARDLVRRNLEDHRELDAAISGKLNDTNFTLDQVLGDWWPPER